MKSEEENNNNNNLKKIREEKGFSLEEVAGKLNLTKNTIKKLEESKYKELGAYTYVRGYMNHYTQLLGVDTEHYLELIPKAEFEVPLVNTRSNYSKGIKLKRHSKNMASYALGTFIVLAISFSGWFLLKNYTNALNKNHSNIEIVDTNNLEIAPQQETSVDTTSTENNEGFHYSSLIPTTTENSLDTENQQIIIPTQTPPKSLDVKDDLSNPKTDKKEAISNENAETQSQGQSQSIDRETANLAYEIKISTTKTSWIKVENLDGVKLHNDLLKPGEIVLQSDEPVHIRIGNKDDVTVVINDAVIDLSQYSRQNIADFNWPL